MKVKDLIKKIYDALERKGFQLLSCSVPCDRAGQDIPEKELSDVEFGGGIRHLFAVLNLKKDSEMFHLIIEPNPAQQKASIQIKNTGNGRYVADCKLPFFVIFNKELDFKFTLEPAPKRELPTRVGDKFKVGKRICTIEKFVFGDFFHRETLFDSYEEARKANEFEEVKIRLVGGEYSYSLYVANNLIKL